ncbi:MAG: hypothetical protein HRU38_23805 [Saccharospirillaceae bacterium]|nr:hypothetical protein [Pseudomonadales bacterium]NRB81648.1 hypothetical protein [Saccharospirillaceae bacterium]
MIYKIHHYGEKSKIDWTCISEVGSNIDGQVLTWELYKQTENKYIALLSEILDEIGVSQLVVRSAGYWEAEGNKYPLDDFKMFDTSKLVRVGGIVEKDQFLYLARWNLRNVGYAYVEFNNGFVAFGDDYYMYIESDKNLTSLINMFGLYHWKIDINPFK